MLGRVFVQHVMEAMEDLKKKNRQLKDALDAGKRELVQLRQENERLNHENLWLTGGIPSGHELNRQNATEVPMQTP